MTRQHRHTRVTARQDTDRAVRPGTAPARAGDEAAVTATSVPPLSGDPGSHGSEATHAFTIAAGSAAISWRQRRPRSLCQTVPFSLGGGSGTAACARLAGPRSGGSTARVCLPGQEPGQELRSRGYLTKVHVIEVGAQQVIRYSARR